MAHCSLSLPCTLYPVPCSLFAACPNLLRSDLTTPLLGATLSIVIDTRLSSFLVVVAALLCAGIARAAPGAAPEAAKLLPDQIGDFRARDAAFAPTAARGASQGPGDFGDFGVQARASRTYMGPAGESITAEVTRTASDDGAYALLTREFRPGAEVQLNQVGTADVMRDNGIAFYKGPVFVNITSSRRGGAGVALELANLLAGTIETSENDIPALVKHLPDWESALRESKFAVSLNGLKAITGEQPVLDAVSFEGGAEAVVGNYGHATLVIVEAGTPQLASSGDARIRERIDQLKSSGQPAPSAYRRVGNYLVFVFGADDEQTAQHLIDGISYEKVVQWLGDNPHILERAQRRFTEDTANLLLGIVKVAGVSFLACLAVGGIFGGFIFIRRRAQQAALTVYSDAGGMVRLNLDDITQVQNPSRLIGNPKP